jgi:hypothetical protein
LRALLIIEVLSERSGKNTMFENRFNDLQFIDGTVIRIKGKITSLDLDKAAANAQAQSSKPKPALSKIRKNMLIVYFNETKPVKKELSDKVNEWKDEGQTAEGLKRQEINAKLQELNKNMIAEFKNATDRTSERKLALSKYKDEAGIRTEMEKLKEKYAKKYFEQKKLDSEIKILNSNVDGTNPILSAPLTDAEKKGS